MSLNLDTAKGSSRPSLLSTSISTTGPSDSLASKKAAKEAEITTIFSDSMSSLATTTAPSSSSTGISTSIVSPSAGSGSGTMTKEDVLRDLLAAQTPEEFALIREKHLLVMP